MIEDVIIVGGGPCGLAAAIALKEKGFNPLIIEKGNVVNAIYRYPTHQTFFSTSEKLEIGDVAFVTEQRKPSRNQALSYYREVVKRKELRIYSYERATDILKNENGIFIVKTIKDDNTHHVYETPYVIIATGYYDNPNIMGVAGEDLPKVSHYFKEAHPYFDKDVVVVGGKNSAVDASIELHKAGARVTNLYRGNVYSESVKPWILPEFDSLVRKNEIHLEFNAKMLEITEDAVKYEVDGQEKTIKNDFVFAMTGYKPDHSFLQKMNINIDEDTGRPEYNPDTMETNIKGVFIAGVIAAGNNANEIFIENGKFHGGFIANELCNRKKG